MTLQNLIIILGAIAILAVIATALYKAKKNDGKIDESEIQSTLELFRDNVIKLFATAMELKEREKLGEAEVKKYVIERLYIEVQNFSGLTDLQKSLITKSVIATFVDTMIEGLELNTANGIEMEYGYEDTISNEEVIDFDSEDKLVENTIEEGK